MYTLGFASLNHDPAIALMAGNRLVAAIESEKITRSKHEVNVFPEKALRAVLRQADISLADVAAIATNYDAHPVSQWFYARLIANMIRTGCFDVGALANAAVIAGVHSHRIFARLREDKIPPIVRVPHHRAHAAHAFLSSPWDEAAVVIIDAAGELECTSSWHCSGRKVRKLHSMDLPKDSLGAVYMIGTRHLGFEILGDEYKVMGLAAYGVRNRRFRQFFEQVIELKDGGRYEINRRLIGRIVDGGWRFPAQSRDMIGIPRHPDAPIASEHADFAFELQARTEEAILHVVRGVRKRSGSRRLCLGGGVALNCVANRRVAAEGGFDEVFVPVAPHDAGTAVGAALHHVFYTLGGERPLPLDSPYLGLSYSAAEIQRELERSRQIFVALTNPARVAAEAVARGIVIGWFQGAAEFGPRALGNRSILADPRGREMKDRVNRLVKDREQFRPFAPAILETEAAAWLEDGRRSPWMLFVDRFKSHRKNAVPAVTHVDGTTRPQTVSARDNPQFHSLIEHFFQITGVPMVMNTSFNVAGEPIVCSPRDAIGCFHSCGLEALFIDHFLIRKQGVDMDVMIKTDMNQKL